ncbi:Muscle M-line assembly protein [Trichinella pseudospiralis]
MLRLKHSSVSSSTMLPASANDQRNPPTKDVRQLSYEIPKFIRAGFTQPEFLKVFDDAKVAVGGHVTFDCLLIGTPRPKVVWLFNNKPIDFEDVIISNTSDSCRLTIPQITFHHYGLYAIIAENEVGRSSCSARLIPLFT